jgi:hypothetical protein
MEIKKNSSTDFFTLCILNKNIVFVNRANLKEEISNIFSGKKEMYVSVLNKNPERRRSI